MLTGHYGGFVVRTAHDGRDVVQNKPRSGIIVGRTGGYGGKQVRGLFIRASCERYGLW